MSIKYRILDCEMSQTEVIQDYVDFIRDDLRYSKDVDKDLISIEEGYYVYGFYHAKILDWQYLAIDKTKQINGVINGESDFVSPNFIFNELSRKNYSEVLSIEDLNVFNFDELSKEKKAFIDKLIFKTESNIYKRHNIKNRGVDLALIKEFSEYEEEIYLEKIFKIHYRIKEKRKDLISFYSGVKKEFYIFNFPFSYEYNQYLKKHKKPITYIPNKLVDLYHKIGFKIYLDTVSELKFIDEKNLVKKIKTNIKYDQHPKYLDYLYKGIFYYKIKEFLYKYSLSNDLGLKRYLLDLYLTLNHNPNSGLILSDFSLAGLCEKNNLKEKLMFLNKSYSLGNLEAKKKLFEHYMEPKFYDEYFIKRYS